MAKMATVLQIVLQCGANIAVSKGTFNLPYHFGHNSHLPQAAIKMKFILGNEDAMA